MNKKRLHFFICLFFLLSSSVVFAYEGVESQGPYVGINLGASFLNDATLTEKGFPITAEVESETGLLIEGSVGYDFGPGRAEVEIGYRKNDIDNFSGVGISVTGTGDTSALSFMFNGFFDIENQSIFTPFLLAGIGFAKVSADDVAIAGTVLGSEDDTVFAYQFGLGVGMAATDKVHIELEYKYFATSDPDFGLFESEYSSHNILLGLRFVFN
ncbi:outer membrane protein [Thermodesulfobacteriota bacterium]